MDLDNLGSLDFVELLVAVEEAVPDLVLPDDSTPEELLRLIRERQGDDDPDGEIAAIVRRKGPSSSGGASALPES